MNADGSNQIAFTNNSVFDGAADWGPDGTKLAFERSGTNNNIDIYGRPFGGFTKNLTNNAAIDEEPA